MRSGSGSFTLASRRGEELDLVGGDFHGGAFDAVVALVIANLDAADHAHFSAFGQDLAAVFAQRSPSYDVEVVGFVVISAETSVDRDREPAHGDAGSGGACLGIAGKVANQNNFVHCDVLTS